MTFRQALHAVRRRWLLIIAVIVLAMAVAVIFLARQTPVYSSQVTVRLSSLAATASSSGQIGTASVDFDSSTITTPAVLGPAAKRIGEPAAAANSWDVTTINVPGTGSAASNTISISATGSTAAQAQKRVTAVEWSYQRYLTSQTMIARKAAEGQAAKWTNAAQAAQQLVDKNPANSIAQSDLASAIASLSSANGTIEKIDSAGPPLTVTKPAKPGDFQGTTTPTALAVALAAGLIAGIGIALLRDAFDDRLRPDDDLEALTGVPLLGELGVDKIARRGRDRLPSAARTRTAVNEGLRSLRTTLQVLLPSGAGAFVVTSVEPGDGKTFISSNLALTWARMGRRVVLIGGDLRNAGLEQYFGEAAVGPGLTALLQEAARSGEVPSADRVASALNDSPYPGLSILPAGEEPWDPADLLAVDALGDIVAELKTFCDVIVIDSPPSFALVDARLLAAHAYGVVVVASMRRTRRRPLAETVAALTASGAHVLGVMINRSRRPLPKSYSAYYGEGRRASAQRDRAAVETETETETIGSEVLFDAAPAEQAADDAIESGGTSEAGPAERVDGEVADTESRDEEVAPDVPPVGDAPATDETADPEAEAPSRPPRTPRRVRTVPGGSSLRAAIPGEDEKS